MDGEFVIHTVIIPQWHPATVNKLLSNRWAAHKLKKSDKQIISHYFGAIPKADGKRSLQLEIILQRGKRGADPDAYFKSLCDGLVNAGMLTDDNRQGVELLPVEFSRDDIHWGSRITLTDEAKNVT